MGFLILFTSLIKQLCDGEGENNNTGKGFYLWGWKCISKDLFPKGQRFGSLQSYAGL